MSLVDPRVGLSLSKEIAASAVSFANAQAGHSERRSFGSHFRTVAVLPLSADVPIERFVDRFADALEETGIRARETVAILNSSRISKSLGGSVFDNPGNVRLENYIAQVEDHLEMVIFVGDISPQSTWTRMCISHVGHPTKPNKFRTLTFF
jgi:hypothetical protein